MAELIQYWDDTLKKYVEVSTTTPLPTNAIGGGAGGAENVEITSTNGAAETGAGDSDSVGGSAVGLLTNDRNLVYNGTTWDRMRTVVAAPDAYAGTGLTAIGELAYNGATWDHVRNNHETIIYPSAVHTGTHSSPTQINYNAKGVIIYLNVTANPGGAEFLGMNLHYVDPASGLVTTLIATLTTTAAVNGMYSLHLYPGASTPPETPNVNKSYSLPLPRQWQVAITHSGAGAWTYSVGCSHIL